jgi:hypothetical protein
MKTIALLFALVLLASPAYAASDQAALANDIVGTVLGVEGLATISSGNGGPQTVAVNTPVHPTDIIATGPRARVFMQMIDNTELTLGENGQMSIDEYAYDDQDDTANHALYTIVKGAFLFVDGLLGKTQNPDVTVNVPMGSIGIRGTKFWGGPQGNDYGVIVGEGEVDVATKGGHVRLSKGLGTTIRNENLQPENPTQWDKTKIDRSVATVALKAPEIIGQRMKENAERNQLLRVRHRQMLEERGETGKAGEKDKPAATERKILKEKEDASKADTPSDMTPVIPQIAPDDASETLKEKVKPLSDTLSVTTDGSRAPTDIVRAAPLRGSATDDAVEAAKSTAAPAAENTQTLKDTVKETVKDAVQATKDTAAKTNSAVKDLLNKKAE